MLVLLLAAGSGGSEGADAPARLDDPANPLDGEAQFVDLGSPAAQQVLRWEAEGRSDDVTIGSREAMSRGDGEPRCAVDQTVTP